MTERSKPTAQAPSEVRPSGNSLVFIGGCPRSGTTWLQKLLSCHPDIKTGPEAHIFEHYLAPLRSAWLRSAAGNPTGYAGGGLAGYLTDAEFKEILESFLASLLRRLIERLEPGQLFLEKTPSNALFLRDIVELLPECRFIYVLRDPRDVVASLLAASRSWGAHWAPKNAREAARMWRHYAARVREDRQQIPAWQFLEVRYEDLSANPERILRDCATFLGLKWSGEELAAAISANVSTNREGPHRGTAIAVDGEQRRRFGAIMKEPHGFVRKAKVGSWKTDLSIMGKLWTRLVLRHEMPANGYRWRS